MEKISESLNVAMENGNLDEILKKDVEFHQCIFEAAGNKRLTQMINSLWEQVYRFRAGYMSDNNAIRGIKEEHEHLIEAIVSGDGNKASKCAKEHIERAEQYMIDKADRI